MRCVEIAAEFSAAESDLLPPRPSHENYFLSVYDEFKTYFCALD
jgi:hypothetical protein